MITSTSAARAAPIPDEACAPASDPAPDERAAALGLDAGMRARAAPGAAAAELERDLRFALGDGASPERIRALVADIGAGALSFADAVVFVDDGALGAGRHGAFSHENGGTIYLERGLLADPAALEAVFLEEAGHLIDARLGGADARGDEGALFAAAANDEVLSAAKLEALRAEDDTGVIVVGGRPVSVEFNGDGEEAGGSDDGGGDEGGGGGGAGEEAGGAGGAGGADPSGGGAGGASDAGDDGGDDDGDGDDDAPDAGSGTGDAGADASDGAGDVDAPSDDGDDDGTSEDHNDGAPDTSAIGRSESDSEGGGGGVDADGAEAGDDGAGAADGADGADPDGADRDGDADGDADGDEGVTAGGDTGGDGDAAGADDVAVDGGDPDGGGDTRSKGDGLTSEERAAIDAVTQTPFSELDREAAEDGLPAPAEPRGLVDVRLGGDLGGNPDGKGARATLDINALDLDDDPFDDGKVSAVGIDAELDVGLATFEQERSFGNGLLDVSATTTAAHLGANVQAHATIDLDALEGEAKLGAGAELEAMGVEVSATVALTPKNVWDAGIDVYNQHVDPRVDAALGFDVPEPGPAPSFLDRGPTVTLSGELGIGGALSAEASVALENGRGSAGAKVKGGEGVTVGVGARVGFQWRPDPNP